MGMREACGWGNKSDVSVEKRAGRADNSARPAALLFVIVKTCSDIFYTIGQKKCPMPSAKIRNYSHSHNLVSQ